MAKENKNYFRHSCSTRNDEKINNLMELMGRRAKEAYFYFFTLIELCASISEDGQDEFTFHEATLRELWRCNVVDVRLMCDKLEASSLLSHTKVASRVTFHIPNLLKYKGKYEKKDEKKALNKVKENKIKENKINKNKENVIGDDLAIVSKITEIQDGLSEKPKKDSFNLESLYEEYPRKEGKRDGLKKLQKIVTSQEKYDSVLLAIKNYRAINISTETKFLKHFSSFVSNWEEYLVVNIGTIKKISTVTDHVIDQKINNPYRGK